jgi:hypothetical protein
LTNCVACLTYGAACAWDIGLLCTGGSCSAPDNCVTPNYGGMTSKSEICALPEAQPPNDGIICSGFKSCTACLGSEKCAWTEGSECVEQCKVGKNCVTPNYGGLENGNDKSAICALPEAKNPTPEGGISCGTYTNCQACLAAGYSFTPSGCAWSKGTTCTATCPGGDATTCVTPKYGNRGLNFDEICALPAALPPKNVLKGTSGAEHVAVMTSLVMGAGLAAMVL